MRSHFLSLFRSVLILRRQLRFYAECFRDSCRYLRAATVCGYADCHRADQLDSTVVRLSHVIEKGLFMPDFRARSGIESLKALQRILSDDDQRSLLRPGTEDMARSVLEAYRTKHQELGIDVGDLVCSSCSTQCDTKEQLWGCPTDR